MVPQHGSEDGSGEETVQVRARTLAEFPGSAAAHTTSHGPTHTRLQCQEVPSREFKLLQTLRESAPVISVRSS
jgi:hypothetical protein